MKGFDTYNAAYSQVFKPNKLSVGIVVPIESYSMGPVPTMQDHELRVKLVESLGFSALWVRDVPFNVPTFGDAGQTLDPFTYLGFLAGKTSKIALGIASVALPLHHPVHIAKAAASIDVLSQGRMLLGVASGDRPDEYPAMGIAYEERGALFRESVEYIRSAHRDFSVLNTEHYGDLNGLVDVLPKPFGKKIPLLVTGASQQTLAWNAEFGDGWISYPKDLYTQAATLKQWRELVSRLHKFDKPFMQPLYIILEKDADFKPQPIQLGFRIGSNYLMDYLKSAEEIGVNHVALNLRFNSRPIPEVLTELGEKIVPYFNN